MESDAASASADETSPRDAERGRGDRRERALLVALVMLAALLPRMLGLDFGLPVVVHVDELEPVQRAQDLLTTGMISEPRAWRYPPLLAELLRSVEGVSLCEGCDQADLIMRGRWLSVIVSAIGAAAITLGGRRLGLPSWAALLAGLLFAWCPLMVRLGRYATPDALMATMVALGVWASAHLMHDGRWRVYLLCGASVGLAAAAKYNAALIFVVVVAVHVLARPRERMAWVRLIAAGVVSVAVFALVLAWPWAGMEPFLTGLRYEWRHYGKGHGGFACANAAWEALRYLFEFGIGPLAGICLVLGGVAMVVSARRSSTPEGELDPGASSRRFALALVVFAGVYLLLLARQTLFFARVTAPLLPALAMLVAMTTHALVELALARFGRGARPWVLTVAIGLMLLLPGVATTKQVRAIRAPDPRLLAQRWIAENLASPEVRIAVLPRSADRMMPTEVEWISVYNRMTASRMRAIGATHVVYGEGSIERFRWRPEENREALEQWDGLHQQLRSRGRLIMRWEQPPLPGGRHFGDAGRTIHQAAIELWALD